jgi:hypothetical protein
VHGAALLAAALFAQGADTLTPDGPATLFDDWHGGQTAEDRSPELLTHFRVTVAPGGRAGTIRLRIFDGETGMTHDAAPVALPAEPGTYLFGAPHILHDYRDVSIGLDQETGGHAIAAQVRCTPEEGEGDICSSQSLDVYRPVLGPGVKPDRLLAEVQRGRMLTIDRVTEPDVDGDLAGDRTEDRTNLRTSMTTRRISGRRLELTATVENAGPRRADRPVLRTSFYPPVGIARIDGCEPYEPPLTPDVSTSDQHCILAPLAVGEQRTVRIVAPDPGRTDAGVDVEAEGPDLASGDESAYEELRGPRPPLFVEASPRPRLLAGLNVTVRSRRAGPVRLRLAAGKRTLATRELRFRRPGARRISLRVPRSRLLRDLPRQVTLSARSDAATARVRLQPSY